MPERVVHNVEAGTGPQRNDVALDLARHVINRHDRAEAHVPVGQRIAIVEQLRTRARADAICPDQSGAFEIAPVLGGHCDTITVVGEAGDHRIRLEGDQRIAPAGLEQNVVQIDAVDDDIGIVKARAKRRTRRDPRYFVAVERVEHQESGRKVGLCKHARAHPDAIEHVEHIGPELDAKADRPKRRCAFEDAYAVPVARQGQRGGEPAKSTAPNEDRIFHGRIALAAPALYRFIHDAATI